MLALGEGQTRRSPRVRHLGAFGLSVVLSACSFDLIVGAIDDDDDGGGGSGAGGMPPVSVGGGRPSVGGGEPTVGTGGSAPNCGAIFEAPEPVVPPLDIILVVDNSGSMHEEIAAIEQNLNVNFAQVLFGSGIDYQLVVVSNHGAGTYNLCIGPPLSNASSCTSEPGDVEGRFHHYDVDVQSRDALCRLLDTYRGEVPDQWGLHVEGWSKWLRPEAEKAFLIFSDDRVQCTFANESWDDLGDVQIDPSVSSAAQAATAFDHALSAADVTQFGTVSDRRYRFYSVLGVKERGAPDQNPAYAPWEKIVATPCTSAMNVGPAYQWLSKGTEAGRYSICSPSSYDATFHEIAADIIADATLPCELKLIDSELHPSLLVIEYTPGDGSPPVVLPQVADYASCMGDAFYIEGDRMRLCPSICAAVESDVQATFEVTCAEAAP